MIEIVPAIDILEGKCVRLTKGDYDQRTEYASDPIDMAKRFEDHGIRRLHVVDLDGARSGKVVNYKILERIASKTALLIDAGGGLKSDEDLRIVFESGASMATGGSIAVKDPLLFESWIEKFGSEKIILGSDFKDSKIAVSGWHETSDEALLPFLGKWIAKGVSKTICTDVSKDGVLEGPSIDIYSRIRELYKDLYLIASGGVSGISDIEMLDNKGIPSVIIGKAIYEGRIKLEELERFI